MRQRKFKPPARKTQRRWRVPPALTHGDADSFEGLSVLEEVPGELGLVLWQSLRDVMLWAQANPGEREALFAETSHAGRVAAVMAAGAAREVEESLRHVAAIADAGAGVSDQAVALACRRVAAWAEENALLATALAFAQAAAVVTPADANAAFAVARLARRRAEHARAESWYRRTIALARQLGDWPTYAQAFVGLGALYSMRGNHAAARRFHERALRAAGRNSLHDVAGSALHELFAIAVDEGDARAAHEMARAACDAYGPVHPELPRLAHEVAAYWIGLGGFGRAVPVLAAVLDHVDGPERQVTVWGDLARAHGGVGDRDGFRRAWEKTSELVEGCPSGDVVCRAWLDLAHGALSLGVWERAEEAAARAHEAAGKRGDARARAAAEAVMDGARRHQRPPHGTPDDALAAAADALVAEFVNHLTY